ncbi:MAG: PLDc N-terminal domain-containing protein [Actinomycetia bacterium]|nr:PLDc N-terminal domain-containing protein [Actinomycetes bacterium]
MKVFGVSVEFLLAIAISGTIFLLWAASFIDLTRRRDLPIIKKAMWAALVIFTGHVGVLIYFAVRPIRPPYGKGIRHTVDHSSILVSEIERLHAEHSDGNLTDEVYLAAKRDLLGVPAS